jgi:energy-coupling factor transport system ATP-binding protein
MNQGKIVFDDTPRAVFKNIDTLEKIGLAVPQITYLIDALNKKGFELDDDILTVEEAVNAILPLLKTGGHAC